MVELEPLESTEIEVDVGESQISVTRRGEIGILHVIGALDPEQCQQLIDSAKTLFDAGIQSCIVDLNPTTAMDSLGLTALIRLHRICADRDGCLIVAGAHGIAERLIRITQVYRVFRVFRSLEDALDVVEGRVPEGALKEDSYI